jgi:hypothetical protein
VIAERQREKSEALEAMPSRRSFDRQFNDSDRLPSLGSRGF